MLFQTAGLPIRTMRPNRKKIQVLNLYVNIYPKISLVYEPKERKGGSHQFEHYYGLSQRVLNVFKLSTV